MNKKKKPKPRYVFNDKGDLVLAKSNVAPKRVIISSGNKRYDQYRDRIERKGKMMGLTVQEFEHLVTLDCYYCGTNEQIGIDRVDSDIGYILGNSRPCCFTCNMMKYKHSEKFFLEHVKKIAKHFLKT